MNGSNNRFKLSSLEQMTSLSGLVTVLGWLTLGALVVSTGIHAVSLVMEHVRQGSGVLWVVRVSSPVLVEILAAVVAVGFANHAWRGGQKVWGLMVEVTWVLFAALNLLTSFTTESGVALPTALFYWLNYGLPVSALVTGVLFYAMLRSDPEHQREAEKQATAELMEMERFGARQEVLTSPQMQAVLRNQAWLDEIGRLRMAGYSDEQISYMMQGVPELKQRPLPQAQLPMVIPQPPANATPPIYQPPTNGNSIHSVNGHLTAAGPKNGLVEENFP